MQKCTGFCCPPLWPHEQQWVSPVPVLPAQSPAEVHSWMVKFPLGQLNPAGGALSAHVAAHDEVIEVAVQLGIEPPPVRTRWPQHFAAAPEHSPGSAPPSVPFEPAQSSGVPLVGQAPPSLPLFSQAAV
jgi:hypothetical protein